MNTTGSATVYPNSLGPLSPGMLAHTGTTIVPLTVAAVVLILCGVVMARIAAHRGEEE